MSRGLRGIRSTFLRVAGWAFVLLTPLAVAELVVVALDGAPESPAVIRRSPRDDAAMAAGLLHLQPDDAALWTLRPGAAIMGDEVNEDGVRGPRIGPREPGVFRIVVLGEGSTLGVRVIEPECWPRRLERQLRDAGSSVEVINLAVDGYTIEQGIVRYREVARSLNPDLVIAYFGTAQEAMGPPAKMSDQERMRRVAAESGIGRFLQRYALYRWLRGTAAPPPASNRVQPARFHDAVAELISEVHNDGIEIVLVVPAREPRSDQRMVVTPRYSREFRDARGPGVHVADADQAMRAIVSTGDAEQLVPAGFELTSEAHRVVAAVVMQLLTRAELVKS